MLGLHGQDFIHNGKKLVNPLDPLVRSLQLGGDMVLHEHLGQVFQRYTFDQQRLKLEHFQRTDRQN
jgi:hypothetical protein